MSELGVVFNGFPQGQELMFDELEELPIFSDILTSQGDAVVRLVPASESKPTTLDPSLKSLMTPWEIVRSEISSESVPAVTCYSLRDVCVGGASIAFRKNAIVGAPSLLPPYRRAQLRSDSRLLPPQSAPIRRLRRPALVPLSTSYWEWGHWWLEMLHRPFPLFLLARDVLSELAIVVPDDLPKWALQSLQVTYGFRSEQLVTYRRDREVVHCDRALLPGMMLLPGRMRFHPLMNQFLDHVVGCCAEHTPPGGSSGLLFLTRRYADSVRTGQRMLSNTAAAEELAASLGFEVVAPEQLDWRQQVNLLARSRVVVGEHGSAMKSLLFAPAGTIGVVLNYLNDSQAAIAALCGQQYVCIECEGYDASAPEQAYSVDLGRLEKVLSAALEHAAPTP